MSNFEIISGIENQLLATDELVAWSWLHRRISEETLDARNGDDYTPRILQLERQLIAVQHGDQEITFQIAERERAVISENKLQAKLTHEYQTLSIYPAPPEHVQAFHQLFDDLKTLAEMRGYRAMTTEETKSGIITIDQNMTTLIGTTFNPNAHSIASTVRGSDNKLYRADATILDEGLMTDSGKIGDLIVLDGANFYPLSVYNLYADQNVELVRCSWETDGEDEDGYSSNPREVVHTIGWLSLKQIQDLNQTLRQFEI